MKKLTYLGLFCLAILATYACAQNATASNDNSAESGTNAHSTTEFTRTENDEKPENASGNLTKQVREIGDFTNLDISLNVETRLVQGTENKVVVEIDDNLQKNIVCTNKNGKLTVEETGSYTWKKQSNKALVTIYFKDINALAAACNGTLSGKIKHNDSFKLDLSCNGETNLDIKCNALVSDMESNGEITLTGEAQKASITNNSNGDLLAKDFKTQVLTLENAANGSVSVYANTSININHSGNGEVVYTGNPTKKAISNTGNGDVSSK